VDTDNIISTTNTSASQTEAEPEPILIPAGIHPPMEVKEQPSSPANTEAAISPAVLQSLIDVQSRRLDSSLADIERKWQEESTEHYRKLEDLVKFLVSPKKEREEEKDKASQELIEVRRKLDDVAAQNKRLSAELEDARKKERDFRFKTLVVNALQKANCLRPEEVFRVISHNLRMDDDSAAIYAQVKAKYGIEELPLQQYIDSHVAEILLPELFEGRMQVSSPTVSDVGDASGRYKYDWEQIKGHLPTFLADARVRDDFYRAVEQGRVKNYPG
jgi:hypothetical protein